MARAFKQVFCFRDMRRFALDRQHLSIIFFLVDDVSALLNHVVEDLLERSEVVVELNCGELAHKYRVLVLLRPLVSDYLFKVGQLTSPQVCLVDFKSFARLLEPR